MDIVKDIIAKVKVIPPLSSSSMKLLDLVKDDRYSLQDITRVVQCDPALTANVLKVVNAPAFGLGHQISSLSRAVTFLGDKTVIGIAIATCSPKIYDRALEGYQSGRGELWLHSLHTAIAARELSKRAKKPLSAEAAFTGGILHDIGKAVLSDYLQDKAGELIDVVEANQADGFSEAERSSLGVDHTQVGLALAEHWNLPEPLRECIRFHHTPRLADADFRPLVYCIHLADSVAMLGGSGTGADALLYPLDELWPDYFTLDEAGLEALILAVSIDFLKTKASLFTTN